MRGKEMSKSRPKVSVLIPLYNRADYIEQTLASVLEQDYENIELIVVDDGSTDGSDRIVERYYRAGVLTLLRHEGNVNKGQSAALNLGLRHATGDYIAILDSDDMFAPGKISRQVEFLEQHPEVGLVYGNGEGVDSDGNHLYHISYDDRIERNDPNDVLLDCYLLLPQNSLVRSEVYKKAGFFDEALRSGQDHDMLIRMAEVTRFAHQPIDAFRYRRHADSISFRSTELRWRCALVILDKATKRYPYRASTLRKRRAVINYRLAQALIKHKKRCLESGFRILYAGILDPFRAFRVLFRLEKNY
jgi:glycosyltransferase involved in cell wall biosynthesis